MQESHLQPWRDVKYVPMLMPPNGGMTVYRTTLMPQSFSFVPDGFSAVFSHSISTFTHHDDKSTCKLWRNAAYDML